MLVLKFLWSHRKPAFSVFMWRNHIPKLNIIFPFEVLVSSDQKKPYSNLTFYNVSARQGSSYSNRARLNFQAFALRDMKIATPGGCRVGQNMSYHFSFCWLNSAFTIRNICFNVSELWSNYFSFQKQNSVTDDSVTLRPPCLCPSEGHKHGVSIQSSINLGDTLPQITREWKTAET